MQHNEYTTYIKIQHKKHIHMNYKSISKQTFRSVRERERERERERRGYVMYICECRLNVN